ncbi:Gfo/Idh/MocA family oxidoreductase [Bacillus sp. DTU_2020_1000418_1_SI_GHA_SEK_038]|uniref:Gfo/Idh/MocA family protein n=1 Tax=Bacillus sp. DTU_2020_1000418_1_SI_GHA_SEK_038 TaxID=3077585 RepID=UPI0028E26F39|nr:Gfo/Idh/MocA family oxidoreductase [Bacillus sp. DTU_2020_1000418_1_SI_GHA_SEK_038]WNS74827.1 Gfo/Idh/MocA family oxidoreductase [Bacillus sp. DTU_2020_1000418_1_SI_GHA_SEK_038]
MNFGIVGCGFIAKKHADAIEKLENAKLIAVCDMVESTMEPYVKQFQAKPFTDLAEMLNDSSIDIICVCTPSGLHAMIAESAAAAKKHVVLEKPMAMTLEEANRIIQKAETNNVKLTVVHPIRFRPAVQELKKIIDQGLLGKISHASVKVNWNRNQDYYNQSPWRGTKHQDGGVLMNQAIHMLDLLIWIMGQPKQVFSMETTRLRNIEAEDVSIGVIRFESGALGTVEASTTVYASNFEESITIFGEKGTIKIGGKNAIRFEHIQLEGMSNEEAEQLKKKINLNPWGVPGHQMIMEDLINAIRENKSPSITGEEGKKALELVLAFYESAQKNSPITIGEMP